MATLPIARIAMIMVAEPFAYAFEKHRKDHGKSLHFHVSEAAKLALERASVLLCEIPAEHFAEHSNAAALVATAASCTCSHRPASRVFLPNFRRSVHAR